MMTIKISSLELLVVGALYAVIWLTDYGFTDALILSLGLHAFFVVAALLVNTVGLAPYLRQPTWQAVVMPYSSLALSVPLALVSPGIEHLHRQCGSTSTDGHGLR